MSIMADRKAMRRLEAAAFTDRFFTKGEAEQCAETLVCICPGFKDDDVDPENIERGLIERHPSAAIWIEKYRSFGDDKTARDAWLLSWWHGETWEAAA